MKALDFKEANTNFGATQDEYNTLPGWQGLGLAVFCFQPDDVEADLLLNGAEIQIIRLSFGSAAQRTGVSFKRPTLGADLKGYLTDPWAESEEPHAALFNFKLEPNEAPVFMRERKIWVLSELTGPLHPISISV